MLVGAINVNTKQANKNAGNTPFLLITVLICPEASFQVPSMSLATSQPAKENGKAVGIVNSLR